MKTVIFVVSIMIVLTICLLANTGAQSQGDTKKVSGPGPSPSRLIATDIEVNQFFNNYIERYTKKDFDGFLWLFSLKAIQNQKDGLQGIKEIYSNFFDQSQTLQCRMEDKKIEIYENGVEVKARYQIEQIVKKSGERKVWRGRIRWVLIKEDGTLKILSIDYRHEKTP